MPYRTHCSWKRSMRTPTRYLVLGPDQAANMLELVVLDRPQGPAVMHAMPMRAKYRSLFARRM